MHELEDAEVSRAWLFMASELLFILPQRSSIVLLSSTGSLADKKTVKLRLR